jgi:hypothetical protein
MNNFHPDNFKPDTDYDTYLPWDQVSKCLRDRKKSRDFAGKKKCPKCGLSSEKLVWIEFSSPDRDWAVMGGQSGDLSICPDCKIQVEYNMTYHNW